MARRPEDIADAAFPPSLQERDEIEHAKFVRWSTIFKGLVALGFGAAVAAAAAQIAVYGSANL